MNSFERVFLTLEHNVLDRVPFDLHNFMFTARLMKVSNFARLFRDGDAILAPDHHRYGQQRCGYYRNRSKGRPKNLKIGCDGTNNIARVYRSQQNNGDGKSRTGGRCKSNAITNLAFGGGFILSPGCALPGSTPDENIMALVETVRK